MYNNQVQLKPIKVDVLGHYIGDYEAISAKSNDSERVNFIRLDFYNQVQNELATTNQLLSKQSEDLKIKTNEIENLRKELDELKGKTKEVKKEGKG